MPSHPQADRRRQVGTSNVERDTADVHPVNATHGPPGELESCHTLIFEGYFI